MKNHHTAQQIVPNVHIEQFPYIAENHDITVQIERPVILGQDIRSKEPEIGGNGPGLVDI